MIAAFLLATTACLPPPAFAPASDPVALNSGLEFLYDPAHEYQVEQVAGRALCNQFQPLAGQANFGATGSGVWLRLHLPVLPEPVAHVRLMLRTNTLDRVCIHWPFPGNTFRADCATPQDFPAGVERLGDGYLFAIPAETDLSRPLHLSANSSLWLKLPLELGTADAFISQERSRQTLWGLYFGLYAALVLLALVLALLHRQRALLYASAQLAALGLALCLWQGFAGAALASISFKLVLPLLGLFVASGGLFYQHLLETQAAMPRRHRALTACIALAFAAIPVSLLWPILGSFLLALLLLVSTLLAASAAIAPSRRSLESSRYLLLGVSGFAPGAYLSGIEWAGRPLLDAAVASQITAGGFLFAAAALLCACLFQSRNRDRERELKLETERELERNNAQALTDFNRQMALHQAQFDSLTRLPTRGKFREELNEQVKVAEENNQRFALVMFGLDNFSAINFALGYKSGDSVLVEITRRLQDAIPAGDRLGRIGADVFAWITEVAPAEAGLAALLEHCSSLQKSLAAPQELSRGAKLNASIGVALYPDHGQTTEYLLRCSDAALHQAKTQGGAAIQVFESALYQKASNYLELKKDFYLAFERGQLQLHYQPIVAVLDGRLSGVEALARWPRADGQYVSPDQFIPIAEAGDLVGPFTKWVVETAVRQMADWRARGVPVSYVSVNGSAAQLRAPEFANYFEQSLRETGLPGEYIAIEVTESNILENLDATVKTLERLRGRGIRVAVDDFGVGHSSLSYLRNLPLDTLKIDRAFLRGVPRDTESRTMLEGIITLAKNLRLPVVAEGVETQPQFDFLNKHGVKSAQGFLFSRALPAPELEAWLTQRAPPSRVVSLVA